MEIISLISSLVSIVLSVYAIIFSRKESKKSEECYKKTAKTLAEIKDILTKIKQASDEHASRDAKTGKVA